MSPLAAAPAWGPSLSFLCPCCVRVREKYNGVLCSSIASGVCRQEDVYAVAFRNDAIPTVVASSGISPQAYGTMAMLKKSVSFSPSLFLLPMCVCLFGISMCRQFCGEEED